MRVGGDERTDMRVGGDEETDMREGTGGDEAMGTDMKVGDEVMGQT